MKLGISIKIDATKVDKMRLFIADSGAKYLDLTTFIDTENTSQYGDHGFVTQSKNKDEGKDVQMPILGNAKVFWQGESQQNQGGGYQNQPNPTYGKDQPQTVNQQPIPDDDIPF